jgi:hypothetical protein
MSQTIEEIYYWIAKNMICIPNKISKVSDEDIFDFISKYKEIISDVVNYMPRGMTTVGAAVARCAIQYDKEKAINFIKNSKERIFQGKEDPVYHFYLWLHGFKGPKRKKHDISTYEITFYACRCYCLEKKIKRLGRAKDNVPWNKNWEIKKKYEKKIDEDIVFEFIKKLKEKNISTNDFIAALQLQTKDD